MSPPHAFFDLVKALSSLDVDKFHGFEIISARYKILPVGVGGISTDVLIPKTRLKTRRLSKCPLMIRIHGGFLVTGSSRYAPWFSSWILDYAERSDAIIVSPNYRLLPEATGDDILQDINDFWNWLHEGGLSECLKMAGYVDLTVELSQLLLLGESAGGYLAVQLALTYPTQVKAVIGAYPMLDLKSPFYTEAFSKPIVGVPNFPNQLIDDHMGALARGEGPEMPTAADPPGRLDLAFAIVQNGRFLQFCGIENPNLFPMDRVRIMCSSLLAQLPPMFIFHGEQDSAVPVEGSRKFIALVRDKVKDPKIYLHVQEGDHGFDVDATLDTPWLRDGLVMISKAWSG